MVLLFLFERRTAQCDAVGVLAAKAGVDCWYKYPADARSRSNTPVSAKFDFGGRMRP